MTSPAHVFPPYWGSGLLHRRDLSRIPPPQVTVQTDHGDQGPHRPLTGTDQAESEIDIIQQISQSQYSGHIT